VARTSFDMDPFVVVSYGTSTFRTSAVRHSLNPEWNEKLFFHVRHNEANFHLKFTVYDREKFSGNDLVAWYQLPIQDIIQHAKDRPSQDCTDCDHDSIIEHEMDRYTFPLQMAHADKWKNQRPTLTIRAKFMPYDQIRKMFWLSLAQAYDAEHTGSLSRLEVQSMLETIGSTITEATIDKFWKRHKKDPKNESDELTLHELVESLENHMLTEGLARPDIIGSGFSETPRTDSSVDPLENLKTGLANMNMGEEDDEDDLDNCEEDDEDDEDDDDDDDDDDEDDEDDDEDWGGINEDDEDDIMDNTLTTDDDDENLPFGSLDADQFDYATPLGMPSTIEHQDMDLAEALIQEEDNMMQRLPGSPAIMSKSPSYYSPQRRGQVTEKVIRLKECPICHRPNLARRTQMDIITHVATCAANDWTTVDRFLMGNFLTEAYAQRR
jgi:phosphatidylserine decarboxylase